MVAFVPILGAALLGLALGLAAGLSETSGTTKRAIGALAALAGGGGLVGWSRGREQIGSVVGGLAAGFIVGILAGIRLRQRGFVAHTQL